MTKLNRVTGKIFGETASPIDDPILGPAIGQFGSAKAGTYVGTDDIATIQSLPAWSNGWIDAVTPTNQYPALPERTGVDKVLSYQQNYILQRGVPEWDENTDYYENCFCSYNGSIYRSIADDNTGNQPDNEDYWELYGAIDDYANQSLTNLTALGNARLQFAPFAINQGTVLNGENNTLKLFAEPTEVPFTQPVLTSNGTLGGDSFAVAQSTSYAGTQAYMAFDNTSSTVYWHATAGFPQYLIFYNPNPLKVSSLDITPYSSYTLGGNVYCSDDNDTWTLLTSFTVNPSNPTVSIGATNYYNYYKIEFTSSSYYRPPSNPPSGYFVVVKQVDITATQLIQAGTQFICDPCTITTCDGRTKVDLASAVYSLDGEADGSYLIFKNYTDGSLSLASSLWISKTDSKPWTQPILSANGTMGGDSFAVAANFERSSHYAWYAMDGVTTGNTGWFSDETATAGVWYSFYNPIPINVTNLQFLNYSGAGYVTTSGRVQISNDGETWTDIKSYTNSTTGDGATWSIDLSDNTEFAKYYRIYSDTNYNSYGWIIKELTITATEEVDNWLDISTVPANLYLNGVLSNDLVYIGDCTISGGVITAISNTNFNSSQSSEWVKKTVLIHNATAINTYEYDLSSYIPKGCSDAEVVLNYFIDETSINPANLFIYSSICQPAEFTVYYATVTSDVDSRIQAGSITLPIGTDRKLYLKITDKAPNQGCYVELRAFRRIGVL